MPVDFKGYAALNQAIAAQNDPLKQFVQGYGTMQSLQGQGARNQLLNMELQEKQRQQEALKGYGETGDIAGVMQKDPIMGLKLTEAQFKIADELSKNFDRVKSGLNKETYGPWREEQIKKYPMLSPSQFPDPSTFKTDEDFTKWKYEKEIMNARFKALQRGPISTGGKVFYQGQWIDPGVSEAKQAELNVKGRGVAAKEAQVDINRKKLDIDRTRVEQEKFTGNIGTAFKILKRRLGRDPSDDELETFNDRFQTDIAKSKNPAVLAFESIKDDWSYKAENDPIKKKDMLRKRTKEYEELMAPYRRGGKGRRGGQTETEEINIQAEANIRQEKINTMPPGPQRNAAQAALDKVLQGR